MLEIPRHFIITEIDREQYECVTEVVSQTQSEQEFRSDISPSLWMFVTKSLCRYRSRWAVTRGCHLSRSYLCFVVLWQLELHGVLEKHSFFLQFFDLRNIALVYMGENKRTWFFISNILFLSLRTSMKVCPMCRPGGDTGASSADARSWCHQQPG